MEPNLLVRAALLWRDAPICPAPRTADPMFASPAEIPLSTDPSAPILILSPLPTSIPAIAYCEKRRFLLILLFVRLIKSDL